MRLTYFIIDVNGIEEAGIPIERGRATVVFGANSSGKSRILSLLARFYQEGDIDESSFMLAEFEGSDLAFPFERMEFHETENENALIDVVEPDQFHPKYFSWKMWREVPCDVEDRSNPWPGNFIVMFEQEVASYFESKPNGVARSLLRSIRSFTASLN